MPLLQVYIAHNGKTLELDVLPSTRVDALQGTLAALTGLSASDQIVMCDGRPLDPGQPLSAYQLPADEMGEERDVFLYCKSHLRSSGLAPEPEVAEPITVEEPVAGSIQYEQHPLDHAPSPLLRALPAYERDFRMHVRRGRAFADAAEERLAVANQLLAEMNVQGLAIDAARSNVEHHYNYIQDACSEFMRRYRAQAAAHEEVLARSERDMDSLAAAELHPAARAGGATRLLDLLPEAKLREWAVNCGRAHTQFADKVADLEGLFGALRADVEALFMQAPSVDVDALTAQARDMRLHAKEQASIAAALESDFARVQGLVEEAVRALSARPSAQSVGPLDAAGVMDTMHESHMQELLPRLAASDAVLARFADHCLACKNQMMLEVVGQLRRISAQQSKISRTRGQLSVFRQVAGRQAEAIAELQLPRRLPTAYRHCLSECMRRKAFAELYAGQAGELAEKMARLRSKEAAARDAFRSAVERYVPAALLSSLGLQARPPHCVVSVPPMDAGLAPITPEDLKRAPTAPQLAALAAELFASDTPRTPRSAAAPAAASPRQREGLTASEAAAAAAAAADADAEDAAGPATSPAALQLENARLRADLAAQVALTCVAEQEAVGGDVASRQRRASRAGSGGGSPAESQHSSGESARRSIHSHSGSGDGLAVRFQEALAAKDDVAARLDRELVASQQQLSAYEARIRNLEQRLTRSSMMAAGSSLSNSSQPSSAAASASSPVGPLLSAAADSSTGALPLHISESGGAIGGGSSPRPQLDVAQRAASGAAIAPSADKPPRSPRLPPSSSPRAVTFAAQPPSLNLAGSEPQVQAQETAAAEAMPQPATATKPAAVHQAEPKPDAVASAVVSSAAASAKPPASAAAATEAEPAAPAAAESGRKAADEAQRTASDAGSVVTSPSLTSLADAAAGTASGASSASAAVPAPVAGNLPGDVGANQGDVGAAPGDVGSNPQEPAATTGFRITGFRVPLAEQIPMSVRAASGLSGASSGSSGGLPPIAPKPLPTQAFSLHSGAASAKRKGSLGLAEVLDAVSSSVPLPYPLLSEADTQQVASEAAAEALAPATGPAAAEAPAVADVASAAGTPSTGVTVSGAVAAQEDAAQPGSSGAESRSEDTAADTPEEAASLKEAAGMEGQISPAGSAISI